MRFVCESCRAQYMINDDKVGPKGVKVRCRKCGYVITVKRPETAPKAPAAVADDAMATQIMTSPMVSASQVAEAGGPGSEEGGEGDGAGRPKESFFGADEEEIGAVFDQVLRSGPTPSPRAAFDGAAALSTDFDEHESTRVIDAATVAQLAKESTSEPAPEKVEAPPETNWFVAIEEKQTGPLTLEKLKEHWDQGDVGPDSLCWREGFQDWVPLSEVKSLAAVLAPKPPKPIVVPVATVTSSPAPAVSAPVQSAFSAGGPAPAPAPAEVPGPMPAASGPGPEETGAWKPTAASALASLVKDEMEALAKPAAKPSPPPASAPEAHPGLLDVPVGAVSAPVAGAMVTGVGTLGGAPVKAPVNPYAENPAATYSAPGMTQYHPPPTTGRGVVIGVGVAVGLVVVVLIGAVVWLASRVTAQPVSPPPVAVVSPPPQAQPVQPSGAQQAMPGQAPSPPQAQAQPVPSGAGAAAGPSTAPTASAIPSGATAAVMPAGVGGVMSPRATAAEPAGGRESGTGRSGGTKRERDTQRSARAESPAPAPASEPKRDEEPARRSGGDEFEEAFGKAPTRREEPRRAESTRRETYVPPAPGSASDVKDTLGQSDIMEVVLSNKPALLKCAEEQRQKEPGTSGKLVVRWSIQGNGRVTNLVVVSEEFKSTHMAGCVVKAIKGWSFPRSKNPPDPFTLPVKF